MSPLLKWVDDKAIALWALTTFFISEFGSLLLNLGEKIVNKQPSLNQYFEVNTLKQEKEKIQNDTLVNATQEVHCDHHISNLTIGANIQ